MKSIISIITIVKDDPVGLRLTLDSLAGQSLRPEVYVISGGGHDGNNTVCREFGDLITMAVFEDDAGIADAFNKGLRLLNECSYVCFLNAGDYFGDSTVIEKTENFIKTKKETAIYYGDFWIVDSECRQLVNVPRHIDWNLFRGQNPINHQSSFVPYDMAISTPYDGRLLLGMDYDMWLKLLKGGGAYIYMGFGVACFSKGGRSNNPRWQVHQVFIRTALYCINRGGCISFWDVCGLFVVALRKYVMALIRYKFR